MLLGAGASPVHGGAVRPRCPSPPDRGGEWISSPSSLVSRDKGLNGGFPMSILTAVRPWRAGFYGHVGPQSECCGHSSELKSLTDNQIPPGVLHSTIWEQKDGQGAGTSTDWEQTWAVLHLPLTNIMFLYPIGLGVSIALTKFISSPAWPRCCWYFSSFPMSCPFWNLFTSKEEPNHPSLPKQGLCWACFCSLLGILLLALISSFLCHFHWPQAFTTSTTSQLAGSGACDIPHFLDNIQSTGRANASRALKSKF